MCLVFDHEVDELSGVLFLTHLYGLAWLQGGADEPARVHGRLEGGQGEASGILVEEEANRFFLSPDGC